MGAPKYKVGDTLIAYPGSKHEEEMVVTHVSENHDGGQHRYYRYYGTGVSTESIGVYESDAAPKPAPAADPQQSASSAQGEEDLAEEYRLTRPYPHRNNHSTVVDFLAGMRIGAERERKLHDKFANLTVRECSEMESQLTQRRSDLAFAREALERIEKLSHLDKPVQMGEVAAITLKILTTKESP